MKKCPVSKKARQYRKTKGCTRVRISRSKYKHNQTHPKVGITFKLTASRQLRLSAFCCLDKSKLCPSFSGVSFCPQSMLCTTNALQVNRTASPGAVPLRISGTGLEERPHWGTSERGACWPNHNLLNIIVSKTGKLAKVSNVCGQFKTQDISRW